VAWINFPGMDGNDDSCHSRPKSSMLIHAGPGQTGADPALAEPTSTDGPDKDLADAGRGKVLIPVGRG
jgi:hypothetical protein